MKRLSIAALSLLPAACTPQQAALTNMVPRPAPENPSPTGIAYLCDGTKEVTVVYAKNRATVTFGDRTWRLEYTPTGSGFRYADTATEWTGEELAALRQVGTQRPIAYNCRSIRRTA